jgi:phosphoribosylformylglycinamidine synthase
VLEELKKPRDYTADLKRLLGSANICDKRWVFEQYDSMVQTNTVQGPGGEAGVMRIKGTGHRATYAIDPVEAVMASAIGLPAQLAPMDVNSAAKPERGIAMALAGNGRWAWLDPKLGAMHAVAEAARKVACTGATPVAATNCLNFGNPEKPEIMAQLSAAIDGIAEACTALGTPVTGGNVSLYNETKGEGIYPTPVIGIVGLLEDVSKAVPAHFQQVGDDVLLMIFSKNALKRMLDESQEGDRTTLQIFGSSEFAKTCLGALWGAPPDLNLTDEQSLQRCLKDLASNCLVHSACDISDGGIFVALAKASLGNAIGFESEPDNRNAEGFKADAFWAEDCSTVIVSCSPDLTDKVINTAVQSGADRGSIHKIGRTVEKTFALHPFFDTTVNEIAVAYSSTLESQLAAEVVTA